MQLSQLLSVVLIGVSAVTAQANNGTDNSTLFDLLTAPNNRLGASSFVSLLSSDPSYQPVIDTLKSPGNLTCFVPNNKAVAEAVKEYKVYAKKHGLNTSVTFPPANTTFGNLTVLDIIKYHCANGTFELTNLTDYVTLLNSTSNATNVDPTGNGLPLLITNNATWNQFNNETWLNASRPYLRFEVGNGDREAKVVRKDIKASNGYLNIIDEVLVPPMDPNSTIANLDETKTFSKVLDTHPSVAQYLNGITNFTLFAPSNNAIRYLHYATLSDDDVKTLVMSHIVNGTLTSADFPQGNSTATNFNNQTFPVFVNGSYIKLNDSIVVSRERNILFNNGIMHVVNKAFNAPATANNSSSTNSTSA